MNRKNNDCRKKGNLKSKLKYEKYGKYNAKSIRIEEQKKARSKKNDPTIRKKK